MEQSAGGLRAARLFVRVFCGVWGIIPLGVRSVNQAEKKRPSLTMAEDLRLSPQLRLCSKFDSNSIARFPVAELDEMGVRVVDNCAEEHIM